MIRNTIKHFSLLLITFFSIHLHAQKKVHSFEVSIREESFFPGSKKCITFKDDSLVNIGNCSALKQEQIILKRSQQDSLLTFLENYPVKKLKSKYVNEKVDDGSTLFIYIEVNGYSKKISVLNKYDEQIALLIDHLNQYLPKSRRIYNMIDLEPGYLKSSLSKK